MKKAKLLFITLLILLSFVISSCLPESQPPEEVVADVGDFSNTEDAQPLVPPSLSDIPSFSGKAYVAVNNNIPYFTQEEYTTQSFENYAELDFLGRCGVAFANIGIDIMPTEERGSIGMVKPSGWQTVKYENVDGKYLYNRCHLIGFQLSGENANEKNLITGTRYMNVDGMLPFENMIADYVKETKNHVLYRVTPIYNGNDLVAKGVLMEALSMEDGGEGVCFNVFCYNEQPGIIINHTDGTSIQEIQSLPSDKRPSSYVGNKNSKAFHHPSCDSVKKMSEKNKIYMECTRDEAVAQGYNPCGNCNP